MDDLASIARLIDALRPWLGHLVVDWRSKPRTRRRLAGGARRDQWRCMEWPEWWGWELELTPHLEKRMEDRGFTEVDLRQMLDTAIGHHPDIVEDRVVIEARHQGRQWAVIVEPDVAAQLLVVVTAYLLDGPTRRGMK